MVTTVNAVTQRTLPPSASQPLTARITAGSRIDRDALAAKLAANGYVRVDTVVEAGEYAVRGSLLDLMPAGSPRRACGSISSATRSKPCAGSIPPPSAASAPPTASTCCPSAKCCSTKTRIKRFRTGYRERFGATATGDPLYEAVSDGRRLAGMEHWLPLFEARPRHPVRLLRPEAR